MQNKTKTYDMSDEFKKNFVKTLDDSNEETDITKAGVFDLCDALSGSDNSKFTVEEAQAEMKRRGM